MNYFQVGYPDPIPKNEKDETLVTFLEQFFLLDPKVEKLIPIFINVDGRITKNRLQVKYINNNTQFVKNYYIDLFYGKNEASIVPYTNNEMYTAKFSDKDEYYMKNY